MAVNLTIDTNEHQQSAFLKPTISPIIKKITTVIRDTGKTEKPKKIKLFQRLKSAILNKANIQDTVKESKEQTSYEEDPGKSQFYTQKQLSEVKQFYKRLLENHKTLSQKDQAILKINSRIFQNIKLMLGEFTNQEHLIAERQNSISKNNSISALVIIDTSGKINFMVSLTIVVITMLLLIKLYQAYNEILKANKLISDQVLIKSRFFTSISHEMRTPLNSILGVTEQLKCTPLNDIQKDMTSLLESSSSMLLSAVNEILDFSRLDTGKVILSRTPFNYKIILNDIIKTTGILAKQKGLTLELNIKDQPIIMLMGDEYRLKQIIINLVANAIKFTDQGSVMIDISYEKLNENDFLLFIQVKDSGIGIAQKDLPFIFNEFSQVVNNKRTDWQKGSGLGLPICKKLVEIHQGKISVSSIVSKGTIFNVELPYSMANEVSRDREVVQPLLIQTDAFKNVRLLIVDDAEMNLLLIEIIFKKLNINFDSVTNGDDALKAFEQNNYDMVLTDIEMPGMDGIQLTKKIRAHSDDKKAQTPIIAITGHISPESHQHYISSGIDDYLIKPYKEKELLEKILDYLKAK